MSESRVFRFENYVLNTGTFELSQDGERISVEPQVFDVLTYLVEHRDRVVPKHELLDNVWGNRFVSESALSSRIKSARRAVGDDGRNQRLIRNSHGRGYQFVGRVSQLVPIDPSEPPPPAAAAEEPTVAAPGPGRARPAMVSTELSLVVNEEFGFVGRSELLSLADDLTSRVADGATAALLIGGEPGIGKTRLAAEIGRRASGGGRILATAGCCDRHLTSSLQPWLEALTAYVAAAPVETLLADTAGVLDHLAAVFPSLRARLPDATDSPTVASDEYAILDAVVVTIERITTHTPLLVILDDVQWAGGATRALASLLLRRGLANVLMGLTFRTTIGDLDDTVRDWLSDLGAHGNVERIDLEGLAPAEAADLGTADALAASETAIDAELIHEVGGSFGRLRFSHQLVPAAGLNAMSASRRVHLHARLAEILEAVGEPAPAVAHHLLEAFPILDQPTVIRRVREVAAAALIEHQYDTAAGLLARCAELPMDARSRAEVLAELGRAYNAAGRQPQALAPFEETAVAARRHGWADLLAAAALGRWGESPFRASQDRTVIPLLDEALGLGDAIDDLTTARLMAKRAAFTLFTRPLGERDRTSAEAERLVGPSSTEDRLAVLEARWMAIACPAMVHEIAPLDDELAILRKELGALTTDACAPEIGIYWRGDGEALWRLAEELEADPRQRRDVDQWRVVTLSGTEAIFVGDHDEARELTDTALPLGREPWGESGRVVHALVHLLIDVLDGRAEASRQRWATIAETVPSDNMRATWAWVEALTGDAAAAGAVLDDVAPRLDRMSENFMGGFGLVGFAEAALALGRDDLHPALCTVLEPLADRMLGHPWAPSLAAADPLCRILARMGDTAAADRHRTTALSLYERLSAATLRDRLDASAD